MNRKNSSDLGDRQAEGNLGSERVRNSSTEGSSRYRDRESSSSEEQWSPGSESPDDIDERTDGSER